MSDLSTNDLEACLIGAIFHVNELDKLDTIHPILPSPSYFHDATLSAIYDSMVGMWMRGEDYADAVLVKRDMTAKGTWSDETQRQMVRCVDSTVPGNSDAYAKHLRRIVDNRTLEFEIDRIQNDFTITNKAEAIGEAAGKITSAMTSTKNTRYDVNDLADKIVHHMESDADDSGIKTGYYELDAMIGGLHPNELYFIAGRPSMGKTSLMTGIAENIAINDQIPVGVFSLEMDALQLSMRIAARQTNTPISDLRSRSSLVNMEDMKRSLGVIRERPLYVDTNPDMSLHRVKSQTEDWVKNHGVKVIFIDYLGLMEKPKADREDQAYGILSRGMKLLSKQLEIPVICLHQLNRAVELSSDKRPMMSHLRGSGDLEQDADCVILLYREDYYNRKDPNYENTNSVELIVAKQRQGPVGTVTCNFDDRYAAVRNYERYEA